MNDSPPDLILRTATPEDAHHLARFNLLFNAVDDIPQTYAVRLADPHRVDTPILAFRDEQAIGFANLRLVQQVFYTKLYAEVTELFVLEVCRRQGVGRRLMNFAALLARQAGAEELVVLTNLDNQAALALYRLCGYAHHDLALSKSLRKEV